MRRLKYLLDRARENDLVFLFYHGPRDAEPVDPKNLYLVLHDSKVTNMSRTALNMSELQTLFTTHYRRSKW